MTIVAILLFAVILVLLGLFINQKRVLENYRLDALDAFSSQEDMKETLRIGLYNRFKREPGVDKEEDPLLFERFVADIMESLRGGRTFVTRSSGDYGIDIEERNERGLYLGQVKCYGDLNPVGFEPVAIVHSQMVKQQASGGYVVTTGRFTPNAFEYAQGLNIELISGHRLVELWLRQLEAKQESVAALHPAVQA